MFEPPQTIELDTPLMDPGIIQKKSFNTVRSSQKESLTLMLIAGLRPHYINQKMNGILIVLLSRKLCGVEQKVLTSRPNYGDVQML